MVVPQLLDAREDVVPAPAVESRRVLAQLVEDLVHLERREQRLDQHRGANGAARHAELVLRHDEDVVPEPRLEMAFQLGQVEIRSAAAGEELPGVVERVEREVEDAAGDRLAVDQHVLLGQVPAARADEQDGGLRVQPVGLALGRRVVDAAANRVAQVDVPLQVVVPLRRVRVLEVRHEDVGAGIERVDHHLPVDRPRDLDPPVDDVGGDRRAGPVAVADGAGFGKEVRQRAGVELGLASRTAGKQVGATAAERALQLGRERDRFRRQDLGVLRGDAPGDLDAGAVVGRAHWEILAALGGERGSVSTASGHPH